MNKKNKKRIRIIILIKRRKIKIILKRKIKQRTGKRKWRKNYEQKEKEL